MSEEVNPVVLETFPNEYIAEVVVGFLKDEGIAAYVKGENLQDPVAASQRAIGGLTVRVYVAQERLEEAREVLAASRAAGHLADEGGESQEDA